MFGGSDPFYLKFWVTRPRWSEIADFEPIFARSASAVTPSEKSSINTEVHYALSNEPRWSSYVAPKPPKWAQKRKTAVFRLKSHFAWRKSATLFLCVKTVSDKVVRHSWPNYIRAKMIGGVATPFTWNVGSNWPRWSEIADFFYFRS